ncbi:YlbL family protein [Actinotalea solisilvae]|uniref:YlbL family protein n=1 Tax=Actinotalea solisilvae TaxID=2072922 RepID=UPI0027DE0CEF|nr:S16 family serine protease [Actinotalea solisilvae]
MTHPTDPGAPPPPPAAASPAAPSAGPRDPSAQPPGLPEWAVPVALLPDAERDPGPAPLTPRAITASVATVATALLLSAAAALPLPYAVQSPGPTRDTLGEEDGTPLISVAGEETFESTGRLLLTTVQVAGGPRSPVGLVDVVGGWFDGTVAVSPVELVFPPDETSEQVEERNAAAMVSSQENATVAALEELGYEVPTRLAIEAVMEGSGADGVIEPEDVVVAVGGTPVDAFSELSRELDEVTPGDAVTIGVERAGERVDVEVTTGDDGRGRALLGVFIDPEFDLPVEVTIEIENIGGPSAGTMFALGIIDRLTPEDETGGLTIAGTGTMDLAGDVGPIGGIRQKLAGARDAGATWFLAPEENCDEVVGHVPDGLEVVRVATLAEARAAMTAIGAGEGADLPRC